MNRITKIIIKARAKSGLKFTEAAEKSGIGKGGLSNLETGRNSNPSHDTLLKLAKAYRCKFTIG